MANVKLDGTTTPLIVKDGSGGHQPSVVVDNAADITIGGVTIADGADVAQGTTTDASTANTVIGRLKKLLSVLPAALGSAVSASSLPVVIASDQGAVAVTPAATESHLGAVGGNTAVVAVSPAVTAGAYTAGQNVGTVSALANAVRVAAGSGMVQLVQIADKAKQSAAIDVIFFNASPAGTYTDNTTCAPTAADLLTVVGVVSVLAGDYSAFSANSVASKGGLGLSFKLPSGTSLYALMVARGTPTYASVSDVQLRVAILQD